MLGIETTSPSPSLRDGSPPSPPQAAERAPGERPSLRLSLGQHSERGRKESNQDFHGALIPKEPLLGLKGIAVVLADGISSSPVSRIASETAVKSFLTDYYCTSDAWSVKTSAQRVIAAVNSWLHAQTRRGPYAEDRDKGYVCTLSALVIKARAAHLFHVGDARIYRLAGASLEQLTEDHRVAVSSQESYLGRALGINPQVEIDYRRVEIEAGDVFLLATDGVYEHVGARFVAEAVREAADLDSAARAIVAEAHRQGSPDNLTAQLVRIETLPDGEAGDVLGAAATLPLPPLLEARALFDGYLITRELHSSSRSHIYLAVDAGGGGEVVTVKIPSIDLRDDPAYLKRFIMEEWVARRVNSAHVLKPAPQSRKRNYLYVVTEFIDGQTLRQWMLDNPRPELETVRGIVEQIARGLQAFHRMEMLHQDLRPENVMIDRTGTAKIIDFGSTRVKGVVEAAPLADEDGILGTAQYTAPEYFLGEGGSPSSDLFSLGVIAYEMLSGRLPYGAEVAKTRTRAQQRKLRYVSVLDDTSAVPAWIDATLRQSVHPDPSKRYEELSEFVYDLRHPNEAFSDAAAAPLMERSPLLFWKCLSAVLAAAVALLLYAQYG